MRARLEAGKFRAVVDRAHRFEADAYRYVEEGEKTGIVVLNVTSAASRSTVSVRDV